MTKKEREQILPYLITLFDMLAECQLVDLEKLHQLERLIIEIQKPGE